MEIVVITGVLALAALALFTLRLRTSRGDSRKAHSARQWSGSAGSRRVRASRTAAMPATAAGGGVAYASMGGGGVAVQDPPRTAESDLDDWDDDLGWSVDLDASEEPAPAPVAFGTPPAPAPVEPAAYDEPSGEITAHDATAPAAEPAREAEVPAEE